MVYKKSDIELKHDIIIYNIGKIFSFITTIFCIVIYLFLELEIAGFGIIIYTMALLYNKIMISQLTIMLEIRCIKKPKGIIESLVDSITNTEKKYTTKLKKEK